MTSQRLRDILRPEAERRAEKAVTDLGLFVDHPSIGQMRAGLIAHHLDILCDDLDANTRALAVAMGYTPTSGVLLQRSYCWLLRFVDESGRLTTVPLTGTQRIDGVELGSLQLMDAYTDQSQVWAALRCIWAALEEQS